jgi:hypothetical protein
LSPSSILRTIPYQIFTQKGALDALAGLYALIFLTGILVYRDYGVSWDEFEEIGIGAANCQMILQKEAAKSLLYDSVLRPILRINPLCSLRATARFIAPLLEAGSISLVV